MDSKNSIFSKFIKIKPFISLLGKNPFLASKFLIKSMYHQINNVVNGSSQINYLTDSEKLFLWEEFVENMIDKTALKIKKNHNLKNPLIVSLTSFPKRFKLLHFTIKSLLSQTVSPNLLLLWIAYDDKKYLTSKILNLQSEKFQIKFCSDLGSYKKIIPTLIEYDGYNIITADDDLYYWPTWIEELLNEWNGDVHDIVAHRIHRIELSFDKKIKKYINWKLEDPETYKPSILNFPTSGAGILFPSGTFDKEVLKIDIFQEICKNCDDVWLYWMFRLNGSIARRVRVANNVLVWPSSQEIVLFDVNMSYKNDLCIEKLIEKYGLPFDKV